MNKRTVQFLFIILLLSACAGIDTPDAGPNQVATETPVESPLLLPADRVLIHSASYTITVKIPTRALSELQRAVEEAGGFVDSASSWAGQGSGSSASLSANVPPASLPALSEAVDRIADDIQSQSVYVQNVTADILRLQRRHKELSRANAEILLFLVNKQNPNKLSTYRILQELLDTDLRSVENQLESFAQQSKFAAFDVTINQPASQIKPIE